MMLAACTAADESSGAPTPPSTTQPSTTATVDRTDPSASTTSAATAVDAAASMPELCGETSAAVLGVVENPALDEASGIVASRRHPGVLWAHNDGPDVRLFAVGTDGADLGVHTVAVDRATDIEDIAIISGPKGDDLLLADIGDNGANRSSIRIYRFVEPDPNVIAPITDVEVLEFVYPDRPHNAEVLLVDEAAGRIVVVTKEQRPVEGLPTEFGTTAPSLLFEGALDTRGDGPAQLAAAGTLDAPLLETRTVVSSLHPSSLVGFGGVPTGGDVAPDGTLIALRTYETIWVWHRPVGSSVAAALTGDPCQVPAAPERQGEAVGFLDGTLLTVSEGVNPSLFELRP